MTACRGVQLSDLQLHRCCQGRACQRWTYLVCIFTVWSFKTFSNLQMQG